MIIYYPCLWLINVLLKLHHTSFSFLSKVAIDPQCHMFLNNGVLLTLAYLIVGREHNRIVPYEIEHILQHYDILICNEICWKSYFLSLKLSGEFWMTLDALRWGAEIFSNMVRDVIGSFLWWSLYIQSICN